MARYGVSITKRVSFRGFEQEFSNVYFYGHPTAIQTNPGAFIDDIVAIERDLHSTDVTFVRAAFWSAGGGPVANEMIHQKSLSGTGNQATNTSMDRERAVLIQWPAGKDSRGRPVFLRKWFHSCGAAAGQAFTTSQLQQTSGLLDAQRTAIANSANRLRIMGAVDQWLLMSKNGREHTGPGTCHKFLEHHQLGEQWR